MSSFVAYPPQGIASMFCNNNQIPFATAPGNGPLRVFRFSQRDGELLDVQGLIQTDGLSDSHFPVVSG